MISLFVAAAIIASALAWFLWQDVRALHQNALEARTEASLLKSRLCTMKQGQRCGRAASTPTEVSETGSSGQDQSRGSAENGELHRLASEDSTNGLTSNVDDILRRFEAIAEARTEDLECRIRADLIAGLSSMLLVLLTASYLRSRLLMHATISKTAALAHTDPLTSLPNRRLFYQQTKAALLAADSLGLDHALLLIDLDGFKNVNDTLGHDAGDELLRQVATRMQGILEGSSLIARLGGDEFAVLLRCDPGREDCGRVDPVGVANRIISAASRPFVISDAATIEIGASVGISVSQPGDVSVEDLLHEADVALYRAKGEGRNCCRLFKHPKNSGVRRVDRLGAELKEAIATDHVVPYFQPIIDLRTGEVIAIEMLARWPHPTRGLLRPAEFIALAEDLDLIDALTIGLLRRGCCLASEWPEGVALTCNLSPSQLRRPVFPQVLAESMELLGQDCHRVEFEVPEVALFSDVGAASKVLAAIRSLGFGISLDGYGASDISLRALQSSPIDRLKIDRGLIEALASAEGVKSISTLLAVAKSLGVAVVAKGIETAEAASILRKIGCEAGQGSHFGHPVAAEHLDIALLFKRRLETGVLHNEGGSHKVIRLTQRDGYHVA